MRKDFDEKALFDLFTDKKGHRKNLNRPFRIGNAVYATNAYRIIGIDASLLKGEYPGDNVPENIVEAIRKYSLTPIDCKIEVTTGQLERALAAIPQVEEEIETDETEECPECHGRGVVTWNYDGRSQYYEEEFECPKCDGEGYVTTTVKRRTNRKIPDYDKAIGFFGLFNAKADNVRALLDTMNLLGLENALLVMTTDISEFFLDSGINVYIAKILKKPCYVIE